MTYLGIVNAQKTIRLILNLIKGFAVTSNLSCARLPTQLGIVQIPLALRSLLRQFKEIFIVDVEVTFLGVLDSIDEAKSDFANTFCRDTIYI